MRRAAWTIALAACIDAAIGDPPSLPHPVRIMGAAIDWGERRFNRGGRGSRAAGAALSVAVMGCAALAGVAARRFAVLDVVLSASTLAARDLLHEAGAVAGALEAGDLPLARSRVARIVGRDTATLDASGVARAAVETLGESACDGIVAPLFWLALAGLPAALAFKAASTLDSMIGHREPRFRRFGAFAARTDDALNFVPARITALLIALVGGAPRRSLASARREARLHASPNAGWPEAAIAAALRVRLGGTNTYAGTVSIGPVFNAAGRPPAAADVRAAMRIVGRVAVLAQLCAVAARA